jgi:signal peptidase I
MMKYATGVQVNKKRGARDNSLEVGDVVFIKNKTHKGLEPRFGPTRFRIIEKLGGTVIVKSDEGTVYKRCTNQVKKLTKKGNGDRDESPGPIETSEEGQEADMSLFNKRDLAFNIFTGKGKSEVKDSKGKSAMPT